MQDFSQAELLALEEIVKDYKKRGYTLLDIQEEVLPNDLAGFIPDLLFEKGHLRVIVEVKRLKTRSVKIALEKLKKKIEANTGWKFDYQFVEDLVQQNRLKKISPDVFLSVMREVGYASEYGCLRAAFLLSWATFEASARIAYAKIFGKPQTPGRIITVLAEKGDIDPNEAQIMRELSQKRNELIHGGLDIRIVREEVDLVNRLSQRISAHYTRQQQFR